MDGALMSFRYYYDLITVLIAKELKIRYKSTFLGYLWSIANPLAFAFTFFIAFRSALKIEIENYLVYLLVGMFPWQFFANSITQSPAVFLANANLIKKVTFPRFILVLAMNGNNAIHFSLAMPVLFCFMIYFGLHLSFANVMFIPVLFFNQLILIFGVSLFLATANLFFRDMENLTVVFTNILFYITPIIYQKKSIPVEYQTILLYNPMFMVVELWHKLMLNNHLDTYLLIDSLVYNSLFLIVGLALYKKLEKRFAEVV